MRRGEWVATAVGVVLGAALFGLAGCATPSQAAAPAEPAAPPPTMAKVERIVVPTQGGEYVIYTGCRLGFRYAWRSTDGMAMVRDAACDQEGS